jgi:hypothetical protein
MNMPITKFSVILFGLAQVLKFSARRFPAFRVHLRERNLVAKIIARGRERD